jgi:hypothetical protein
MLNAGPRRATVALWITGAGLAATTGALSVVRSRPGYGLIYGSVATGLGLLAWATNRRHRTAQWLSLVLLASQLLGALGAAWELLDPDAQSAKARHLRHLGVSYRWALIANLVYSLAAGGVFCWAVVSARASRSGKAVRSDPSSE